MVSNTITAVLFFWHRDLPLLLWWVMIWRMLFRVMPGWQPTLLKTSATFGSGFPWSIPTAREASRAGRQHGGTQKKHPTLLVIQLPGWLQFGDKLEQVQGECPGHNPVLMGSRTTTESKSTIWETPLYQIHTYCFFWVLFNVFLLKMQFALPLPIYGGLSINTFMLLPPNAKQREVHATTDLPITLSCPKQTISMEFNLKAQSFKVLENTVHIIQKLYHRLYYLWNRASKEFISTHILIAYMQIFHGNCVTYWLIH